MGRPRSRAGIRFRPFALALAAAGLFAVIAVSASAEVAQKGDLRVSVDGRLNPHTLPRHGLAPVAVSFDGRVSTTNASAPPQLRVIAIAINRHGLLDASGLPICHLDEIQPASTVGALRACRGSRVGQGHLSANVALPTQAPFPSSGKVIAFNGRQHGKPVILAHVYGTEPIPTSYTLTFAISRTDGTFATVLTASLPQTTGEWGFVTGIQMTLHRSFTYRGSKRSYLSATCPTPAGVSGAVFTFARTSFAFAGGADLSSDLTRTCGVRGS